MTPITDISQLDLNKTYSYADYLTWQFGEMVELIKGKIFKMSPTPKVSHQKISANISNRFYNFLHKKPCSVYYAPFDVRLPIKNAKNDTYTVVQPDICIICDQGKIDENGCNGSPDLIVEILSQSTKRKDLKDKYEAYEESGVKEYWVVYPSEKVLEIFVLENEKYQPKGKYFEGDIVSPSFMPDFKLELTEVFED